MTNTKRQMKRIVVIIDEYHVLRNIKTRGAETPMQILETLAGICRSAGIHLILCTQSPRAEVITGLLKSNMVSTLGLRAKNELNSRIIIDSAGLEKIKHQGRGILQVKGREEMIQTIYLDEHLAENLVKPFIVDKEKEKKNSNFEPKQIQIEKKQKKKGKIEESIDIDNVLGVDEDDE